MKKMSVMFLSILLLDEIVTASRVEEVEEGDDVLLQCQQDPRVSFKGSLVEWSKDGRTNIVHVYRHGRDYLDDQKEEFKNRTVFFHEGLSRGNASLKLSSVRLSDNGTFRCYVRKLGIFCFIILKVVQKGQNNPTQADDFTSTALPVETVTEPNDPGGKNMMAVFLSAVALLFITIGVVIVLFKCGIIQKCMEKLRERNGQNREGEANGSEMEELKTPN